MNDVKHWDLVLWPFQTMRELQVLEPNRAPREKEIPIEWAEVLKVLNPKVVVPSSCQFQHESWSWYNEALFPISYQDFRDWCKEQIPNSEFIRLDPGQTLRLSDFKRAPPLSFVQLKDSNADYKYNPNHQPQSLNEIAIHFPRPTENQRLQITEICEIEIPKFLSKKKDELDQYFEDGCKWTLKLYWGHNEDSIFSYSIGTAEPKNQWFTEISAYKLWSAIEKGETLTSLYMRINDQMDHQTDVLEDPLIRYLFDGKTNQYHLNQLRELGIEYKI